MNHIHDYRTSLVKGLNGKAAIKKVFADVLTPTARGCDFKNPFTGAKVKLKTDQYCSGNIIFEITHNDQTAEPGAPYKAKAAGATVYAYYFERTGQLYYLDLDKLIEYAETQGKAGAFGPTTEALNDGYTSVNWKVPIKAMLKAVPHLQVDINDSFAVEMFTEQIKAPLPPVKPIAAKAPKTTVDKPKPVKSEPVFEHGSLMDLLG